MPDEARCYVCGTILREIEYTGDEHSVCNRCGAQAWDIYATIEYWPDSEDHDLKVVNAAIEAMRRARMA